MVNPNKFDNIVKFSSAFVVRDLPKITNPTIVVCKECILAKQKKVSFPSKKFGIDYEETYASIAIMEVVRMFMAYVANKKFKVCQNQLS